MQHSLYSFCRGEAGEGNRKIALIKCLVFMSNVLLRPAFKNHTIKQKKITCEILNN